MASKLDIPVGAAFEKRLAELVWENCPELARQTAAGRIALAIDVTDKAIISEATNRAITEAVHRLIDPLLEKLADWQVERQQTIMEAAKALLDERVNEVATELGAKIDKALNDFLRLHISKTVRPTVDDAVRGFFNDRPIARRVGEVLDKLIKDYLKEKLESEEASRGALQAAERELAEKVGQEDS